MEYFIKVGVYKSYYHNKIEVSEGNRMKRIFITIILVISFLSACNSSTSTLSFSEIEIVPENVQGKIDSNLKLQLIKNGEKGYYIVFQSSGEVETDLLTEENTVTIKFNILNKKK
jgi:hypothetical protein